VSWFDALLAPALPNATGDIGLRTERPARAEAGGVEHRLDRGDLAS